MQTLAVNFILSMFVDTKLEKVEINRKQCFPLASPTRKEIS
jgi:hypothetical protein